MIPAIAANLATLATDPRVTDVVAKQLPKLTNNKVKSGADIKKYVGQEPSKLKMMTDFFARQNVFPRDQIIPPDLVRSDLVKQIDAGVGEITQSLNQAFAKGVSVAIPVHHPRDIAQDKMRIERVKAVLSVFRTWQIYKLAIPNGGVPDEDYVFYNAMKGVV